MRHSKQDFLDYAKVYNKNFRSYMLQVYNYITVAFILTGGVSLLTLFSETAMSLLYIIHNGQIIGLSNFGLLISFAPIVVVLVFGFRLARISINTAQILYWTYAILFGLSISSIFLAYLGESIAGIFFIAAFIFASMSFYGVITKRDLTSIGSFLIMGLIGLSAVSMANLFLGGLGASFAISVISVLVFTGLTAFDSQRLKDVFNLYIAGNNKMLKKVGIIGALTLYMDFINIFIHLFQLLGTRRDK